MNAFGEEYHLRMLAVSQSIGVLSIFKCSQRCCVLKKKVKWRNISLKKATEIEVCFITSERFDTNCRPVQS